MASESQNTSSSGSPFPKLTAIQMAEKLNDWSEHPFVKLMGKGLWFLGAALIGLGLYAGKQKAHEFIADDPVVASALANANLATQRNAETRAILDDHTKHLAALDSQGTQVVIALKEIASGTSEIKTAVAVLTQRQEDNRREQSENIHRIDTTLAAIKEAAR